MPVAQFLFLYSEFQIKEKDGFGLFCNLVLSTLILLEKCQGFALVCRIFICCFFFFFLPSAYKNGG